MFDENHRVAINIAQDLRTQHKMTRYYSEYVQLRLVEPLPLNSLPERSVELTATTSDRRRHVSSIHSPNLRRHLVNTMTNTVIQR